MQIINVAIIGVTGFTGIEALRTLLNHPFVKISNIVGNSHAGKRIEELYPALQGCELSPIQKLEEVDTSLLDCIFTCLPHGTSQAVISGILEQNSHIKIIDLSADFRLPVNMYEQVYGKHMAPQLQTQAVYGLCDVFGEEIANKRLIACPGCFPTSALVPLMPIKNHIDGGIVIDSKTGISGAGRKEALEYSFVQCADSVKAYNPHQHRHRFEIEHYLGKSVRFTPHLVPIIRGIETSIYFNSKADCRALLLEYYKNSPFVYIANNPPSTREVLGTNLCKIYIDQHNEEVFISSVIDNISKGSSTQAVQNMNIAFGFSANAGLQLMPIIP